MIVQPRHKLLSLAAVLLGADPSVLPALLAELPSPTFPQALLSTSYTIQKHHPYIGNLSRGTSGDGRTVLLHCGCVTIKQLHILTSGMQQRQVWFVVLCTVMLATCRLCQHICDWDASLHTPSSDTFSIRRCTEHVSDPTKLCVTFCL